MKKSEFYSDRFYDNQRNGSMRSAEIILRLLYEIYQPNSVIDIGCGLGTWLSVAESLGSKRLRGMDGDWVSSDKLLSKNIDFTAVDIEHEIEFNEKYDLCISLEVAEHLPPRQARPFVASLCKASNVVLFSSAIKHQGGTNHVNEQWQSYWIELFQHSGFECFDIFRSATWDNNEVDWWYRQNIFLFINLKELPVNLDINQLRSMEKPIQNIIHPENYESKTSLVMKQLQNPSLQLWLVCTKNYVFKNFKKILMRTSLSNNSAKSATSNYK